MICFRSAVPYFAAGGLLLIDANFVLAFALAGMIGTATPLEIALFAVQVAKTMALLALKPLRRASPAVLIDVYGADLFLLPILLATVPLTGLPLASEAMYQVFGGWAAGVAFAGLPYAAFRIGRGMLRSASLASVAPSGILASELSILLLNATLSAAAAGTGLSGLVGSFLRGGGTVRLSDPVSLVGMTMVYTSLLAYAVLGLEAPPGMERNRGLLAGLLATAGAVMLAFGTSGFPTSPAFFFVPPTMAMAAATWWFTREH